MGESGLRYVSDSEPGIRRIRRGRGFSYVDSIDGSTAGPDVRARIKALAIPPAWNDVWICRDPNGHLQATGRDARGRKQYRYHNRWTKLRSVTKFDQLSDFGASLPAIRSRVATDLARPGLPLDKVAALVIALLDTTLIRVGNEEYRRSNGTFGLTTLGSEHVDILGSEISFRFVGKSGVEQCVTTRDRRLARVVRSCHELGGKALFTYRGDDGLPVRVDSSDCNSYLAEIAGGDTTVKYFRTWGATVTVLDHLVHVDHPLGADDVSDAVLEAASVLGNTRAVCRRSYVHPLLTDRLDEASLREAWRRSRTTETMTRAERAAMHLLAIADSDT